MLTVTMLNVAAYFALAQSFVRPIAAAIVAAADAVLAAGMFVAARRAKPGPELELAEKLRDLARNDLKADAEKVLKDVNDFTSKMQAVRSAMSGLFGRESSLLRMASIVPLLGLLLRRFRRSRRNPQ